MNFFAIFKTSTSFCFYGVRADYVFDQSIHVIFNKTFLKSEAIFKLSVDQF